ncbi:MAG: HEAT repeat domain-containing protein [Methanotrichaceae archaeon]|jgi:hypothetical protein
MEACFKSNAREGIDGLLDCLSSSRFSLSARREAVRALGKIGDRRTTDTLKMVLLDNEDHRLRLLAARELGMLGNQQSSSALILALEDRFPSVRHEAIIALGRIGDKNACIALTRLLDDQSSYLRRIAARALIHISGVPHPKPGSQTFADDLECLYKLLNSGCHEAREAIVQPGALAIRFLNSKLEDGPFSSRRLAAAALAVHIRKALDCRPPGEGISSWLKKHDISQDDVARFYRFKICRQDGQVRQMENTDFDQISEMLLGGKTVELSKIASGFDRGNWGLKKIDLKKTLGEIDHIEIMGRTLVAPFDGCYLAIKLCTRPGDEARLVKEARLQRHLSRMSLSSTLPRPLSGLFEVKGLPSSVLKELNLSSHMAICYLTDRNYFVYLNDPLLSKDDVQKGLAFCSQDLARLMASGMIHTSLIPLFHDRERVSGRGGKDGGTYHWHRKIPGRLERWLESCRYPNLRMSGIADLEHIELHRTISSRDLQIHIGEHLLSMSLILGSYFRHREEFDQKAIASTLKDCFEKYCSALAGSERHLDGCIDWIELADRMIDEMEGDKYMRGKAGILNGPHLGAPNGPFPLPELIRAIHITSLFATLDLQVRSPD